MKEAIENKLPLGVKIGYGVGGFATIFTLTIVVTYGMFYFTDVVGLQAGFVGIMLGLGTLWDAITDPLVGYWSDSREGDKGRRRPFLFWVAVPFGLSIFLLFTKLDLGETATLLYYAVIFIFYYTMHTIFDVPYTALAGEMTTDYDERTSLTTFRRWASDFAGIAGGMFLTIVYYVLNKTGNMTFAWSSVTGFWAIICTVLILICWRTTKGYELKGHAKSEKLTLKYFIEPWKNKSFVYVVAQFSAGLIGQSFVTVFVIYYFTHKIGLNMGQVGSNLMASFIVSAILWTPVINKLARKYSKKVAYITLFIIGMIAQIVLPLLILKPGMPMQHYLFSVFYGAFNAPLWMITWAMIPDCIEVDVFKTGRRRDGMYFGVLSLIQKSSAALAVMVGGFVLQWIGYVAGIELSAEVLNRITYCFAFIPAAFMIISIIICYYNPMNRKVHKSLVEIIELKEQGEEYDITPIKSLL